MLKKIGLWGSICSIISFGALFFSQNSVGDSQITHGSQSPSVKAEGNVNINYNGSVRTANERYNFLQHPEGGGTILVKSPTLAKTPEILCHPESGSRVEFVQEHQESPMMIWVKVKVISGTCNGKVGWVGKDNYHSRG